MTAQLHIAALNVVTTPPSTADQYLRLLTEAFLARVPTRLRGDWVGLLGACRTVEDQQVAHISGDFYKYFDLNLTRDWFNLTEGKKADPTDLQALSIPENLKPHFNVLPFVFFPEEHRLIFVTKDRKDTLSPAQAQKIVLSALQAVAADVLESDKTVEVIIEQSRQSLDAIFSMEVLQSLTIEVIPPNPFAKVERQLLEDLGEERVTEKTVHLRSGHPNGLAPSMATRLFARLALSLGRVEGKGKNANGQKVDISTTNHPNIERHRFFPNLESARERLIVLGRSMLAAILAVED